MLDDAPTRRRTHNSPRTSPFPSDAELWGSPIIYYEVALQELTQDPNRDPSAARFAECMRLYDEVAARIPKWQQVLALLKSEILVASLSSAVTTKNALGRVPFFDIVEQAATEIAVLKTLTRQDGLDAQLRNALADMQQENRTLSQECATAKREAEQLRSDLRRCDSWRPGVAQGAQAGTWGGTGKGPWVDQAGCDKCKKSTVHHPSSHHSRMGGGTRLPQTSFTPPLWTGDRVALQALDSHPWRGWDRTAPGRW